MLYSKYSPACKKLSDTIRDANVDPLNRLQYLCIDNEKVRKRVLGSKNIQVSVVPCILAIYPDGGVEKFDGGHAHKWVETVIEAHAPPPPEPTPAPPEPETKPASAPTAVPAAQQSPPPQPQAVPRQQAVPRPQAVPQGMTHTVAQTQAQQRTSIDALVLEDREPPKPPVMMRNNQGNYDRGDALFQADVPARVPKVTTTTSGETDIMAMAKAMEKSRTMAPPPPGHPDASRIG